MPRTPAAANASTSERDWQDSSATTGIGRASLDVAHARDVLLVHRLLD